MLQTADEMAELRRIGYFNSKVKKIVNYIELGIYGVVYALCDTIYGI